jgi:hypothetical protein
MEAIVMGFALLLVRGHHGHWAIPLGAIIALLLILTVGALRSATGWILGTGLQVVVIAYGAIITSMYFMGILFTILWGCAYYFGKKAESIRKSHSAEGGPSV